MKEHEVDFYSCTVFLASLLTLDSYYCFLSFGWWYSNSILNYQVYLQMQLFGNFWFKNALYYWAKKVDYRRILREIFFFLRWVLIILLDFESSALFWIILHMEDECCNHPPYRGWMLHLSLLFGCWLHRFSTHLGVIAGCNHRTFGVLIASIITEDEENA